MQSYSGAPCAWSSLVSHSSLTAAQPACPRWVKYTSNVLFDAVIHVLCIRAPSHQHPTLHHGPCNVVQVAAAGPMAPERAAAAACRGASKWHQKGAPWLPCPRCHGRSGAGGRRRCASSPKAGQHQPQLAPPGGAAPSRPAPRVGQATAWASCVSAPHQPHISRAASGAAAAAGEAAASRRAHAAPAAAPTSAAPAPANGPAAAT